MVAFSKHLLDSMFYDPILIVSAVELGVGARGAEADLMSVYSLVKKIQAPAKVVKPICEFVSSGNLGLYVLRFILGKEFYDD